MVNLFGVLNRHITLKRSLCHNLEIFLKKLKNHSAVALNFLLKRKGMKQIVKVTLMTVKPRMKVNLNFVNMQSSLYNIARLASLFKMYKNRVCIGGLLQIQIAKVF